MDIYTNKLSVVLQITLALRALQYVALYRSLGPLLVTIVEMFADILSFVGFYVFILLGFANGFFVIFSAANANAAAAGGIAAASLSYASIVEVCIYIYVCVVYIYVYTYAYTSIQQILSRLRQQILRDFLSRKF